MSSVRISKVLAITLAGLNSAHRFLFRYTEVRKEIAGHPRLWRCGCSFPIKCRRCPEHTDPKAAKHGSPLEQSHVHSSVPYSSVSEAELRQTTTTDNHTQPHTTTNNHKQQHNNDWPKMDWPKLDWPKSAIRVRTWIQVWGKVLLCASPG